MMHKKDIIKNVQNKTALSKQIIDILQNSYLDSKFESKWLPSKFYIIENSDLQKEFNNKINEFQNEGCNTEELDIKYGFLVENDNTSIEIIANYGLAAKPSDYNILGNNYMGVYLCKHADICLKHGALMLSGAEVIKIIIFKFVSGRTTTAIPRLASAVEFIEPTPTFNMHVSVIPPLKTDSIQNQFDRSQLYIYDINNFLQPVAYPRQIIPFGVIFFTINGATLGSSEFESETETSCYAGNVQLQKIIDKINAKAPTFSSNDYLGCNLSQIRFLENNLVENQFKGLESIPTANNDSCISSFHDYNNILDYNSKNSIMSKNDQLKRVIDEINSRSDVSINPNKKFIDSHKNQFLLNKSTEFSISNLSNFNNQSQFYQDVSDDHTSIGLYYSENNDSLSNKSNYVFSNMHLGGLSNYTNVNQQYVHGDFYNNIYEFSQNADMQSIMASRGLIDFTNNQNLRLNNSSYQNVSSLQTLTIPIDQSMTGLVNPNSAILDSNISSSGYYPQNLYGLDYMNNLGSVTNKDKFQAMSTAYYQYQAFDPTGYALINSTLKRSITDNLPYTDKQSRLI